VKVVSPVMESMTEAPALVGNEVEPILGTPGPFTGPIALVRSCVAKTLLEVTTIGRHPTTSANPAAFEF
jgi:hypothetical protein